MKPKVLFIGSIGVVAETSEIQRIAYNKALEENGIDWNWSVETYKKLLQSNGGRDRLEMLAMATGKALSETKIKEIHTRKTELAGKMIVDKGVQPRPGLVELITEATKDGVKVAWVTTTGHENTGALLTAFNGTLLESDFDHIFHREDAANGKPSSDIYYTALNHFKVGAADCIAVEDSLNSILAAKVAGIFSVATLGEYHDEEVENIADLTLNSLADTDWSTLKKQYNESIQPQHAL